MPAVDVCVGHAHDLVIAQLFEVELIADSRPERLDQRADFLRRDDAVEARALDVQDLALQRQDRLNLAVAALLRRSACRVTLDKEKLAFGGRSDERRGGKECVSTCCSGLLLYT